MFFVVLRRTGPQWRHGVALEDQDGWDAHAAFMDRLVDDGRVVLGGPLADEHRVVFVMQAASADDVLTTLRDDPWHGTHLEVDAVEAWTIRLADPALRDRGDATTPR